MSAELSAGNIFIRPLDFGAAGNVVDSHAHNFEHVTYVVRGGALFERLDGEKGAVIKAIEKYAKDNYNWVLIPAGVWHRITALTDDALCHCIYSHRNPQGEVVQEYDGWMPGYE